MSGEWKRAWWDTQAPATERAGNTHGPPKPPRHSSTLLVREVLLNQLRRCFLRNSPSEKQRVEARTHQNEADADERFGPLRREHVEEHRPHEGHIDQRQYREERTAI